MPHEPITLEAARQTFFRALQGKNRSDAMLLAYNGDLVTFISWLQSEVNISWAH
jgi:hypothetical protein